MAIDGPGQVAPRVFSLTDLVGVALIAASLAAIITAIIAHQYRWNPWPAPAPAAAPEAPEGPTDPGGVSAVSDGVELPEAVAVADDGTWPAPVPGAREAAVTKADALVVLRVPRLLTDNPYWERWRDAAYVEVPVMAQQMAMPTMATPSIDAVRVQGLTDGRRIAWRVSWKDPTADGNVDTGRFSDAVAVGFPLDAGAPPMMGADNLRVQILYWKALWQKDLDVGFQDVQDLHPNFWSDLYWFAEGEFPYPVPASFQLPASRQWFIAHQAGNPMAAFSRSQPIEELVAEGWSTLTHQPHSASAGKGAWKDGVWSVVISRPLKTTDPLDYTFTTGGRGQIVCAVWQGSEGNRGGRKHWSMWTDFEVQQ
jgi:hypothetical protein